MIGVTVVLLSLSLTAQARETLFGCEGETLELRYLILVEISYHHDLVRPVMLVLYLLSILPSFLSDMDPVIR